MKQPNHNIGSAVVDDTCHGSGAAHCGGNARQRSTWRRALSALSLAPTRLHQYRNLRTAMFYDAMRKVDRRTDHE